MTSQFRAFNRRSPRESDPNHVQAQGTRANLMALASAMVLGGTLPGWSYTNSVTRSESSPGTADQPVRAYFSYVTDTTTIWVRVALTWDADGYPTEMAFSWSDDDEASYDDMDDLNGNSVLSITYDSDHNITAMDWSA